MSTATFILFGLLLLYAAGLVSAPFPYWPTYRILWRTLLRGPWSWRTRMKQAVFLLRAGATAPLKSLFWYMDEVFFPAYRRQSITPVFIIGQPRCGTTLLHRTMAADDRHFFAVRHLEWRYPFICVQKLIRFLRLDARLGSLNYWPHNEIGRKAARMHSNRLSDWEEDGIFFEEIFLHHFFIFLRFPDPEFLAYLDNFSDLPPRVQEHMLNIHRRVIQKVCYLNGAEGRCYLSKEVTSHNKIPSLLRLYPDSRFVIVTRHARFFMSSLLALMQASTEAKTRLDPTHIAGWRERVIDRMREDSGRFVYLCREVIPRDRQSRVSATHLMMHVGTTVTRLYGELGLTCDPGFMAHLAQLEAETRQRDRGYTYDELDLDGFEEYDAFVDGIVKHYSV